MFARIILASKPTNGAPPIFTIHAHYPDIIHGEVLTHRDFSRNARSMRAVPVKTLLEEVRKDPFVPWHWGMNQKGMQATEECNEQICIGSYWEGGPHNDREIKDMVSREDAWIMEANHAADKAEAYANAGYHKQVANRIIAPYTWKDTLITSTKWANFLHLRDHSDAEPHFQDLAKMVREALLGAEFQELGLGWWHLPYIDVRTYQEVIDYLRNGLQINPTDERILTVLRKVSVARCARISYRPFNGDSTIAAEVQRHDDLVASNPLHASPAEHQAKPDIYRVTEKLYGRDPWENSKLAGNLGPGWIQYRKTLAGEYIAD